MNTLIRIVWAVGVFVVAWLVLWLVGAILVSVPTEPTVWLGNLIENIAVLLALLIAILWFVSGRTWNLRG